MGPRLRRRPFTLFSRVLLVVLGAFAQARAQSATHLASDEDLRREELRALTVGSYRAGAREHRAAVAAAVRVDQLVRSGVRSRRSAPSSRLLAASTEAESEEKVAADRRALAAVAEVEATKRSLRENARSHYETAAGLWDAVAAADDQGEIGRRARAHAAEARYWALAIGHALGGPISAGEYGRALAACVEVSESSPLGPETEIAARRVVEMADELVDEAHAAYRDSGGEVGFPRTLAPSVHGSGFATRVDELPLPPRIRRSIAARDDYVRRLGDAPLAAGRTRVFVLEAARPLFLYGKFHLAIPRLRGIWNAYRLSAPEGREALDRLLTILSIRADQTGDPTEARALAEEAKAEERSGRGPVIEERPRSLAASALVSADRMAPSAERAEAFREAGRLYEQELRLNPRGSAAPKAAINGAYAYTQAGDYTSAARLHRLLLDEYGAESELRRLAREGPPGARELADRRSYAGRAALAFADAQVMLFDLPSAAAAYEATAQREKFEVALRTRAAQRALLLHATTGDRDAWEKTFALLRSIVAKGEKLEADGSTSRDSAEERLAADTERRLSILRTKIGATFGGTRARGMSWRQLDATATTLGSELAKIAAAERERSPRWAVQALDLESMLFETLRLTLSARHDRSASDVEKNADRRSVRVATSAMLLAGRASMVDAAVGRSAGRLALALDRLGAPVISALSPEFADLETRGASWRLGHPGLGIAVAIDVMPGPTLTPVSPWQTRR